ncbi:MAG: T9SS type A sorting domain-containing protein, partial [Bacteroidia bacterium]|nr:T9SS type A sorting domain-containing protein [Bacteroidia bacterium]
ATSNGFSVVTNGENYLIDSALNPYFNQPYFYVYNTGVSHSSMYHRNYNADLLLSNDSFIVSVNSRYMSGLGANILYIKFYKSKISTSLQQPIMVDSGTILHSKYPSNVEPYLNVALLNSNAITVKWWCNKKNIVDKKYTAAGYPNIIDIYGCYLQHSSIKPDTVILCARNYFKSQYSVDVCRSIIFTKDSLTSIDENIKESIKVYPNPATDFVEVEAGNLKNVSVQLYNLLGQELQFQEQLPQANGVIRLYFKQQTKGIYTLKITTDEGSVTQKILIAE